MVDRAVVLLSNVNLYTEKNALIVFSSDTSLYPIIEASFEGLDTKRCQSPISAMNAENIAITGGSISHEKILHTVNRVSIQQAILDTVYGRTATTTN